MDKYLSLLQKLQIGVIIWNTLGKFVLGLAVRLLILALRMCEKWLSEEVIQDTNIVGDTRLDVLSEDMVGAGIDDMNFVGDCYGNRKS